MVLLWADFLLHSGRICEKLRTFRAARSHRHGAVDYYPLPNVTGHANCF